MRFGWRLRHRPQLLQFGRRHRPKPESVAGKERHLLPGTCNPGGVKSRIMYVELKTGYNDNGPAWIGRVGFAKTGRPIYYRGKSLRRIPGGGISANYRAVETGDQYWISGVKKSREDRHWAGAGPVEIDEDVRAEYERLVSPMT